MRLTFFKSGELPKSHELATPADTQEPVLDGLEFDPYKFVADHEIQLAGSSNAWTKIAKKAKELTNEKSKSAIKEGLPEIYAKSHISIDENILDDVLEDDAEKICRDLSVYTLLSARYFSANKFGMLEALEAGRNIRKVGDNNVAFLISKNKFMTLGFGKRIGDIASSMEEADGYAAKVLTDLSDGYAEEPEGLIDLAELYSDGVGTVNPAFAELKEMIAQDWHARDPSTSILRSFLVNLAGDPRAFVNGFSKQIEEAEQNKRLVLVKKFAEFVMAAADTTDANQTVGEVLRARYDNWDQFPEVQIPFETYVKGKLLEVEKAIGEIAGPFRKNSIRTNRTQNEIQEYERNLKISVISKYQRTAQKPRPNSQKRKSAASRALPIAEDLDKIIHKAEEEPTPRQLVMVKRGQDIKGQGSYEGSEITLDEVSEAFSIEQGSNLEEDVKKMVTRLQVEPISKASRKLKVNNKIYIDGKTIDLRRFAPNDCQGLSIHGDNRYHRIVYGFNSDKIFLVDVLDHDSFDKKYPK